MAVPLWSNPSPNNQTAAELGNAVHIDQSNIGSLVSSILQFREAQARRQQQDTSAMLAGIAKGAQGFSQNAQQGQADDAANATMYGIQNPNDPYGGFSNPDVVPDYGGTDALKMLESAKSMGGYESPEQKALMAAKLDAEQARAHDLWTYPAHADGGSDSSSAPVVDPNTGYIWNGRQWVKPSASDAAWEKFAPMARGKLDPSGNFTNQYTGAESGDQIQLMGPNGKPIVMPYDAYQQKLNAMRSAGGASSGFMPPTQRGGNSQSLDDIKQAAAAMGYGTPSAPAQAPVQAGAMPSTPAPANTGIAASREEAQPGGYYRAPDGSIRQRQN